MNEEKDRSLQHLGIYIVLIASTFSYREKKKKKRQLTRALTMRVGLLAL
jgi:hypothetical protein